MPGRHLLVEKMIFAEDRELNVQTSTLYVKILQALMSRFPFVEVVA